MLQKRFGRAKLKHFYFTYLSTLCSSSLGRRKGGNGDDEDDEDDDANDADSSVDIVSSLSLEEISSALSTLRVLEWSTKLFKDETLRVLQCVLDVHVSETCKGEYGKAYIPELQTWLQNVLLPFAQQAMGLQSDASSSSSLYLSLSHALLRSLAHVRARELFDMVADFPESLCALKELKEAIAVTKTLSSVGKLFRATVCKRLLHMGASTSQILDIYVSMIRALRVMDSSDLLLNYVAAPVRRYLTGRKDTVRCIVSALIEGKGSELHGELRKGGSLEYGPDEDDEDAGPGDHWEPRKRDRQLVEEGGRGLDILALLVSIYGSTDLFVSDYRAVLAEKLLSNLEYRADSEVATLELLKIRFGDEALHSCEVMLRDLEESRRVNTSVHQLQQQQQQQQKVVDLLIVSDNYWPALQTEPMALHPSSEAILTSYCDAYAATKKQRALHSVPQLGMVEIDLDFDDGSTRSFVVAPAQATLIQLLADAPSSSSLQAGACLSLSELATKCELEESEVHRRMAYWTSRSVVREVHNVVDGEEQIFFEMIEQQAARAEADKAVGAMDTSMDDDNSGINVAVAQEVTEKAALSTFEAYVKGMLSSHGTMTLEKIHNMLKMVASGGSGESGAKFDMNLVQLLRFLQTLIDKDMLEVESGNYRLRKA